MSTPPISDCPSSITAEVPIHFSANRIIPAHVPHVGLFFEKSRRQSHMVFPSLVVVAVPIKPMAVDSPPGNTIPSKSFKSSGTRTWRHKISDEVIAVKKQVHFRTEYHLSFAVTCRVRHPIVSRHFWCSSKAPCSARTPISGDSIIIIASYLTKSHSFRWKLPPSVIILRTTWLTREYMAQNALDLDLRAVVRSRFEAFKDSRFTRHWSAHRFVNSRAVIGATSDVQVTW